MLNQAAQKLSKMHARRNPGLSIQSTASYAQLTPPVHSAASGFLSPTVASRRGLLARSPPPSPSLPSLIPRHGKKGPQRSHSRLVKRVLIGCCGLAFILLLVLRQLYSSGQEAGRFEDEWDEYEMVGGNGLPKEPSAVAVQDSRGRLRWTVSIPSSYEFPLRPAQYREICHQSMELSKELRQGSGPAKRMLGYNQRDKYFVDVQEAQDQQLLPAAKKTARPKGLVDDERIAAGESALGMKVCEKSLTYVMETDDAGFGNTLMRMWMAYGLAQAENRTFFLDDTRWPYGRYSTYFLPPPSASCLPPPPSQIVPCPHTARHIVVSAATTQSTFGHAFTDHYEDGTKMRVARQHKIFALARTGYEALFKLRTDDAKYVLARALELNGKVREHGGISIGLHIRRGDKHPLEYQYAKDYIPLARYVDAARDLYISLVESPAARKARTTAHATLHSRHTSSKLVVATDDPAIYEAPDLGPNTARAQNRIVLATKAALMAAQPSRKNNWLDDVVGWEGGFYRDVFFGLGMPDAHKSMLGSTPTSAANQKEGESENDSDKPVPESAMKLREFVGRSYLLDLGVLGKTDAVVCTVGSAGCRVLGVMMGWEGVVGGRWRNVDGEFDWRGVIW